MYIEELPVRLAHRVKELDELPQGLNKMPSIEKVKNWYAQSFEDLIELKTPQISNAMKAQLVSKPEHLPHSVPNPSLAKMTRPQNLLQSSVPISQR